MQKQIHEKPQQVIDEEIKQIVQKINEKQQKFEELLNFSEQNVSKTISLVQKQFDKVVKKKKKEIRQLLHQHEQKIKEIQKEFQVNQDYLQLTLTAATKNYLDICDQLSQEQQKFISQFDYDEGKQDSTYVMTIYEVLTDIQMFNDNSRSNEKMLSEIPSQQSISKFQNINNQLKRVIQKLLTIEENLSQQKFQDKKNQSQQFLLHDLKKFVSILTIGLKKLEELYCQIHNSDSEITHQERIIQNNVEFITSLMKQNQERIQEEENDFVCSNEKLFTLLNKLKGDVEKFKNYQKQNQENFKSLIDLINGKGEKIRPLDPIIRKNTFKILQAITLSRNRIFSDSQQNNLNNLDQQIKNNRNDHLQESQNLYQSTNLDKTSGECKNPSVSEFSHITKSQNFSNKITFSQRELKGLKPGQIVDKKTAIPLKCQCPPQCLCQAQLVIQFHSCNNQLYINSKGEIICQRCNLFQDVWTYNFLCPQNKIKNKFYSSQEFLDSIWKQIKCLTIDEQLVDFWSRLQMSCFNGFQDNQTIIENEKIYNFLTRCPQSCQCKCRESYQQYHISNTQFLITKSGYSYCKKCQIYMMINQQFIYCQKTKKYNIFCSFDDFLNAVELQLILQYFKNYQELQGQKIIKILNHIYLTSFRKDKLHNHGIEDMYLINLKIYVYSINPSISLPQFQFVHFPSTKNQNLYYLQNFKYYLINQIIFTSQIQRINNDINQIKIQNSRVYQVVHINYSSFLVKSIVKKEQLSFMYLTNKYYDINLHTIDLFFFGNSFEKYKIFRQYLCYQYLQTAEVGFQVQFIMEDILLSKLILKYKHGSIKLKTNYFKSKLRFQF